MICHQPSSVLSSFGATVDSFSVQDWVFLSIYSFIHCSFSTEYSVPAIFQAGCEALKTQGRANPGILPEAGHPPHREATSTVQGDIGPGRGQGATSWKTQAWGGSEQPHAWGLEDATGASGGRWVYSAPASPPGGFSPVSWWPRGNKPAALRTRTSLIPTRCTNFLLQNLRGA